MDTKNLREVFGIGTCAEANAWLQTQQDLETAWVNCERGDWMWWAVLHTALPSAKISSEFAQFCADAAARYAAARYADARYAAADDAAAYAAAAADAADAAAAYAAAYAAADAAAYAAAAAAAADAKIDAYTKSALLDQAKWIRGNVPNPFVGNKIKS